MRPPAVHHSEFVIRKFSPRDQGLALAKDIRMMFNEAL